MEDGSPSHVWLSYADFERLIAHKEQDGRVSPSRGRPTLVELFDDPAFDHWPEDVPVPKLDLQLKVPDLS